MQRTDRGERGGPDPGTALDLYWLPLGAGGHCVRLNGRVYERVLALTQRRAALDLYHAALVAHLPEGPTTVEMGPAWDDVAGSADRGAVVTGPVGLPALGRWSWFRYEVRCWHDGVIPDLADAVDGPRRLTVDEDTVRHVLRVLPLVPPLTWGRDELGLGEMWNSNSVVAWALVRGGVDVSDISPPRGGRAPGFAAGLTLAETGFGSEPTARHHGEDTAAPGAGPTSAGPPREPPPGVASPDGVTRLRSGLRGLRHGAGRGREGGTSEEVTLAELDAE